MFLDDRLMGTLYTDPFRGRSVLTFFQLEVGRGLFSLYQRSGIGFILQNADDRCGRPFTIFTVRIAAFGVGHPIVALISQR